MNNLFLFLINPLKYVQSRNSFYVVNGILHVRNDWCLNGGNEYGFSRRDWYNYHNILLYINTGCKYCINDDMTEYTIFNV